MKLYRTTWNVQDSTGAFVQPGGTAKLDAASAVALAAAGAIEAEPLAEPAEPTAEQRLSAILALVPSLQLGDFTQTGQLRVDARRRLTGELGFEPSDDEIRAAGEAFAKAQTGVA